MPETSPLKTKIKVIFLPFILLEIGVVIIYGAIRWLLDIKLGILSLHENLLNTWLPFIIPWVPIFFWIRPKLNILEYRDWSSSDNYLTIQFFMGLAIAVSTIFSQEYLIRAAYPLVALGEIEELAQHPKD